MPSVKGSIKVGRHTEGHGAWLKARGYTVTEEPGKIIVEGSSFVESIDLSGTPEQQVAELKKVIEAKSLLTYETKAVTPKGPRSSIMLCGYLGAASALVVKPVGKGAKTDSTSIFAAL